MSCQRRVGPGCAPGCLLVEWRGVARERQGLCADWPYCGRQPGHSWLEAVRDALVPPGGAGPSTGRAPAPTALASASRWLKILIIYAYIINRAAGYSFSVIGPLQETSPCLGPVSLYALDLVREVGRVEVDPGCPKEDRESEGRSGEERGDRWKQHASVDRNHLGSNLLHQQLSSPSPGEERSFPLSADQQGSGEEMQERIEAAAILLREKGTDRMDADKNDGRLTGDWGDRCPDRYTPRGHGLIVSSDHSAGEEAPARFPIHIKTQLVDSFIMPFEASNCNTADPDFRHPDCPCLTRHRPEYTRGVRPPEADVHLMVTARGGIGR